MPSPAFEPGTALGNIHLLEFAGRLCDYEFWHAARVDSGGSLTRVSVKFAASGARSDAEARLSRELTLAGFVAHPNVLRILDLHRLKALDLLVTEPIMGPSVAQLQGWARRRRQRVPIAATLELLEGVARALAHAWRSTDAQGLHVAVSPRVLTPSRIIICPGGQPAVTDFSSAWTSSSPGPAVPPPNLDEAPYRAPELHSRPWSGGAASDMFSLGVLALEFATGRPFVEAETVEGVWKAVASRSVDHEVDLLPSGLSDLSELLRSLLQRDPRRRLRDPIELLAAIREVRQRSSGGLDLARAVAALSEYRAPAMPRLRRSSRRGPGAAPDATCPTTEDWSVISRGEIDAAVAAQARGGADRTHPTTEDWSVISRGEIDAAVAAQVRGEADPKTPSTEDWSIISLSGIRTLSKPKE